MNKIGVLLPRSILYPSINFDIMDGLRASLAHSGVSGIEIKTESIGIAGNTAMIYAACEKMIFDGVTLIIGYITPDTATALQPLLQNAGATAIALDAGYQFPQEYSLLENVYTISLQGALGCRLLADRIANDGIDKVAFASSFYDAGYRSAYAFFNGYHARGGIVAYTHITKLHRSEFTLKEYIDHLEQHTGNGIFATFCGDMALDFLGGISPTGLLSKHQAYCSPFMAEELWLDKIPYPGGDIKTYVTWARELDNDGNKIFSDAIKNKKKTPNVFSVLGWEAGMLMSAIADKDNNEDIVHTLNGYSYNGPRGAVTIHAATHRAIAPFYDATIIKNETNGNCALQPGAVIDNTEAGIEQYEREIRLFSEGTSWLNAYPCLDT